MRRIVIWLASTVTVVVLLLGYHTSTNAAATAASTSTSGAPAAPSTTTTPRASDPPTPSARRSSSSPSAAPSPSPSPSSSTKSYTGDVTQTRWGPVQVKITVTGGTITKVSVLQSPSGNGRDAEINSRALPVLTSETLDAQSAKIDMVSGATVTSGGYLTSLQSAIDQAGI